MISYDEAIEIILQSVRALPAVSVATDQALGCVLAEPVASVLDLPPADNSAMDGYAFCCAGLPADRGLTQVAFVPAGSRYAGTVQAGQAVRIMTGAPLPDGCDTVVPIEDVDQDGARIVLHKQPRPGDHVRYRGEEISCGELALAAGASIHSGSIALLASSGIERVSVFPPAKVAILSTGDELVELGQTPTDGKIINSNSHLLAARVREAGCEPLLLGIARDTPDDLKNKLKRGLKADLLLTSGGVSVGDCDHVQQVLDTLGFEKKFWKVAIKPGKPVLFGTIAGTPVFGLPGNPASSAATFDLFVRPALKKLTGRAAPRGTRIKARLTAAAEGGYKRQTFLWGRVAVSDGQLTFTPSRRQGSGQNRSLQQSDALLPVPTDNPQLAAGSEVEIILLRLPDMA